jgi:hypothetical protein
MTRSSEVARPRRELRRKFHEVQQHRILVLILAALVAATSCGPRDRTTPEEEAVRGDELPRTASDTLKNASAFSFSRDITVTYDG